jgi:type I restriction-modification system DNA methylase subunit
VLTNPPFGKKSSVTFITEEGGAGETVRRKRLHECDVHTLLRLPIGIFYAQGVKAVVLFFNRKPGREKPGTSTLWMYDLRTNANFTLMQNPLGRGDLDEFVAYYPPWSPQPVVLLNPEQPAQVLNVRCALAGTKAIQVNSQADEVIMAQGRSPVLTFCLSGVYWCRLWA